MSDPFDGSDDLTEIQAGRGSTEGTWSPDWILLSGCSPQALKIYQLMRLRLNRKRRDKKVWPGTATLAAMMNMKLSDSVTPYLKELEKLGAITIHRERMPRRNIYVIHTDPEPDYDGPMVMEDWDSNPQNRLEVARIRAAEKAKRDKARGIKPAKDQVSPDPGKNRYQAKPRLGAVPDTGKNQDQDPGKNRYQDPAKNQDHDTAKNQDHSSREPLLTEPPTPPTPSAAGQEQEEQQLAPPNSDPKPLMGDVLSEHEQALFADCMATRPDWSPSELREVLASSEVRDRPDRDLVRRAFLLGADDLGTKPRRMLYGACPHWKTAIHKQRTESAARVPAARTAPAGMYDGSVRDKSGAEEPQLPPRTTPSASVAALFAEGGFLAGVARERSDATS